MYLGISMGLFLLFVANVLQGSMGGAAFLSDVSEMLLLAAVSVSFVFAMLKAERKEKEKKTSNKRGYTRALDQTNHLGDDNERRD